ncbi:26S proteasome non-ATPase regulatory subunit 10-like [Periplaneta americana]|uniref:26S proteasome non-ATPase regulatory subunit 10-like n=1 Tax=Periplaneta americana TaxID=6978 RepID=UPI0037E73CDB
MAKPNPIPDLKQRVKTLEGQVRLLLPLIEEVRVLKERLDSRSLQGLEARKEEEKVGSSNNIEELKEKLELRERELRETQAELEKLKEESERDKAELIQLKQKFEEEHQLRLQQEKEHRAVAEVGPDLEEKDGLGWTQLHRAAWRGDARTVQLLLDAGSQVNAEDHGGRTPLWLAASNDRQDACRALLAAGARPDVKQRSSGSTALHVAAANGHRAVCELLLAAGARPNEPDDADQWTALHWAALLGHAPVVQLLLQYGAERGVRDKRGWKAVDMARQCEYAAVAAMLQG